MLNRILFILIFLIFHNFSYAEDVTFSAVGDILLDRGIRNGIKKHGMQYPLGKVAEFIKSRDLAFCNLECPISKRGKPLAKMYAFRADYSFIEILKSSGFNTFSLANNHSLDYGREALKDTKAILDENGFVSLGVGENQKDAIKPVIVKKKDTVFAFFSHVLLPLEGIVYSENLFGPSQAKIKEICREIKEARKNADIIIVSFHWGTEYKSLPSKEQIEYAHKVIESGADIVIGHHPHVIQSIEKYKDSIIIYSMGNFLFDQHKKRQKQSFVFCADFKDKKISNLFLIPTVTNNYSVEFARNSQFEDIYKDIVEISKGKNISFKKGNDKILIKY